MPTESAVAPDAPERQASYSPPASPDLKCALCGLGAVASSSSSSTIRTPDDVVILSDPIERICGSCVRTQGVRRRALIPPYDALGLTLPQQSSTGVAETAAEERGRRWERRMDSPMDLDAVDEGVDATTSRTTMVEPMPIPLATAVTSPAPPLQSQSLPAQHTRPWTSTVPASSPLVETRSSDSTSKTSADPEFDEDVPYNPLLDITKARVPNVGRGALFAGSIFRGTQTSGRSAYEVEVRILDVNFPQSTLSGYLSISHLTDSHPHLTTFFTGEIIGPQFGFITGARYGATEHDDMRHWGRFEQFRRPATRGDMMQPELLFRDPLPDRTRGETQGRERDFVFLRIKERFLVPDHTVRDISGASFAGFYYAMVDLSPSSSAGGDPATPLSPTLKSPSSPVLPTAPRRMSSSEVRSPTRPTQGRRRQSSSKFVEPVQTEATIRGYYFHSLNQEPFQELFLTHVPSRSSSTMEMR